MQNFALSVETHEGVVFLMPRRHGTLAAAKAVAKELIVLGMAKTVGLLDTVSDKMVEYLD